MHAMILSITLGIYANGYQYYITFVRGVMTKLVEWGDKFSTICALLTKLHVEVAQCHLTFGIK